MEIKIIRKRRIRQKKLQPKQNETKSLEKYHWVGFLLATYAWQCSLPWSVVSRLQWGSVGNNRLFPLCQQVWIIQSFLVGWGAVHFMLQCCDPVRPCECSHSLWKFLRVSVLLYLEDTVSSESALTSGSYNLSMSSSTQIPVPWGEGPDSFHL